jgi:hypothetical protein
MFVNMFVNSCEKARLLAPSRALLVFKRIALLGFADFFADVFGVFTTPHGLASCEVPESFPLSLVH